MKKYDRFVFGTLEELEREMDARPGWAIISITTNQWGGMGYIAWLEITSDGAPPQAGSAES
jgi:hypothetical protein